MAGIEDDIVLESVEEQTPHAGREVEVVSGVSETVESSAPKKTMNMPTSIAHPPFSLFGGNASTKPFRWQSKCFHATLWPATRSLSQRNRHA